MDSERFTVGLTPLFTASRISKQRSALRIQVILAAIVGMVLLVAWVGPRILPDGPMRLLTDVLL